MRTLSILSVMALACGLTACGGAEAEPTGNSEDTLTFKTGEFEIPPGDSFECFYTDTFTDREMSVFTSTGKQGPGGHHILVYYTDVPREPQHHPCVDSEMVSWHQISAASGEDVGGEGVIPLPEGVAIKVPEGKQLVLQAHYINTTGASQKVNDEVTLHLTDPAKVEFYVNYFVIVDEGFEVPPFSPLERSSTCTVDRDLDVLTSLGHMHEHGTHYKLERIDEKGETLETLHDNKWEKLFASHPPVAFYSKEKPLRLTKGTRLRQTCNWENTTTEPLLFPREMCIAFFYYFPDAGEIHCEDLVAE